MAVDQNTLDAALEFIRRSGAVSGYVDNIDLMYQAALDHVRRLNAQNGDAAARIFRDVLKEALLNEVEYLEELLAEVYAERFDSEELHAMRDFFETPVGRKMIQSTSIIAINFSSRTEEFQKRMASVIMPRIREDLHNMGFAA